MTHGGSWSYSNNNHNVSLLSTSQQTALPLPKAVKGNRSFANLAKLFGISKSYKGEHSPDADEDEEEEVEAEDVMDEDSLMWDAQVSPSPLTLLIPKHTTYTHRTEETCRQWSHDPAFVVRMFHKPGAMTNDN
jgi:hypothetical protein